MITERQYLESLLQVVGGTIQDHVFCLLRNNTNPKYGGDPKWTGSLLDYYEHKENFKWEIFDYVQDDDE